MRPTRISRPGAVLAHRLGPVDPSQPPETPPPASCCDIDPDDIPDRGASDNGGYPVGLIGGGSPEIVQTVVPVSPGGIIFPIQPTPGNTIVMLLTRRDSGLPGDPPLGGWTTIDKVAMNTRSTAMWYRVVTSDESAVTNFGDLVTYPAAASGDYALGMEIVGTYASITSASEGEPESFDINLGAAVAAPDDSLMLGVGVWASGSVGSSSITPDAGITEIWDENHGGFSPGSFAAYREVTTAGSFAITGECTIFTDFAGITAVFTASTPTWSRPIPNTVDSDDATYETFDETDLIRIDLGGAYRIVRTRIRVAGTTAGARTFTLKAANEADFSDEVTIATIDWTAVGSLTAQDVEATWYTTDTYRYWELSVDDPDTYRIYTWSLYEPTLSENHQTPIELITTDEDDTDLVLHPDGTGGVEWGPGGTIDPDTIKDAGRWELAVVPGSPPDSLYADGDWLYIWVPGP